MKAADSSIVVRPARIADWTGLWPLLEAMGKTDSVDRVRERFRQLSTSDDHLLVIGFIDDVAVGYAWAEDRGEHLRSGWRTARVHDLFVLDAHRRRGVGRALFRTAKEWARGKGVRWLEWQASKSAVGFYQRLGLHGDSCPDPEHPYFEIDFANSATQGVQPASA